MKTLTEQIYLEEVYVLLNMVGRRRPYSVTFCTVCQAPWHMCNHDNSVCKVLSFEDSIACMVKLLEGGV